MQSVSLDMDDIYGAGNGYMSEEEFPPVGGSLPPLSPNRNINDPFDEDNPFGSGGDLPSDADKENQGDAKRPRKLVMRKPQPKLDATRLCSDRGLPTLSKHFEQVKFKGKGHEVGDLNRLMSTMEHWAHRLFPKMPFDEVIERIEKLGRKKPVQTCIRKIRLDMPLMDDDFEGQDEDVAGDKNVAGDDDDGQETAPFSQLAGPASQTSANNATTAASLSEEQKDRIERNKRLAMERRKSKGPASSSQVNSSGISAEEMLEMEGGHADEAEVEDQLWNDIAMFEVTQRNIWKKSPEEVAKNSDSVPNPPDSSQVLGETAVPKNGQSDYTDLTVDSVTEVNLISNKPEAASEVINVDSEVIDVDSEDEAAEAQQDAAEDAESAPSDLNLKWDSESADESMIVQEPCEHGENPSGERNSENVQTVQDVSDTIRDADKLDGNNQNGGEGSESTEATVDQNALDTSVKNIDDVGGNDGPGCTRGEAEKGTVISTEQKELEIEEAMEVE